MSLLLCENVSLGYDSKVVLSDLSFFVNSGDYLCIVGENGSGKSTLMKTILGLKMPLSGKISMGDGLKQNEIGYLPQQTVVQRDFPASVWEIVLSGCLNKSGFSPFYSKENKKRAKENMERMNITSLSKQCYREYQEDSNRECFLQDHFVQLRKYCCLTSLFRDLIQRQRQKCIRLYMTSTSRGLLL